MIGQVIESEDGKQCSVVLNSQDPHKQAEFNQMIAK